MINLESIMNGIRSELETISAFPIYTGILSDTNNLKEGLVKLNENDPWRFGIKEQIINIQIIFRFDLDNIQPTGGSVYTEDTAAKEFYNLLNRILFKTIPPGVTLQHVASNLGYDEQGKYVCQTNTQAYCSRL